MSRRNPGRASRNRYGQPSDTGPLQQPAGATPLFVMRKTSTTHRYMFMPGFAAELRHEIYDYHLLAHNYKCQNLTIETGRGINAPGPGIKYPCPSPLLLVSKEMAADVKVRVRAHAHTHAPKVQACVVDFNLRTLHSLFTKQMKHVDFTHFDNVRRRLNVLLRVDHIHYEDAPLAKWIRTVESIRGQQGPGALKVNYEVEDVPVGKLRVEFVERMNELGLAMARPGGELAVLLDAFATWWEEGEYDMDGDGDFEG
ncbi:hypothetical protein LTR36_000271 [Oleoguttula mirabilis]|uniref:Uncharacterized protein n=1 Tax=Oleoguttula mirabilis TaxID=1507867 RepID=A0AAV9JYC5_9PEZI|nr:hypothetical protein LTR36_000271 [Oleoguttula mirabilis]